MWGWEACFVLCVLFRAAASGCCLVLLPRLRQCLVQFLAPQLPSCFALHLRAAAMPSANKQPRAASAAPRAPSAGRRWLDASPGVASPPPSPRDSLPSPRSEASCYLKKFGNHIKNRFVLLRAASCCLVLLSHVWRRQLLPRAAQQKVLRAAAQSLPPTAPARWIGSGCPSGRGGSTG